MQEERSVSEAGKREERVLKWWKEHRVFEQSMEKKAPHGDFVFYEGPPTANGKPGIHHLESRAFKDAIPRYKTMRGYRVLRRAGWDTHGLPVELEVEKQLGFSGKPDIEKFGVAAFNAKCRESVLAYIDLWDRFTKRIGYWVDQEKAYFTFDATYMESLWATLKSFEERLYKDYKVLPWCSRCGTALSSHELAQGYEDVKDLSLTAKFELVDEPGTYFLAWTTTPWTLPGNVALAVGKDITYGVYAHEGVNVIAATARAEKLGLSAPSRTMKGSELVGKTYKPLFDFLPSLASESEKEKFKNAYQVYAADFVTTEDGTGIVHTAVMYGADDFELGSKVGLPKVHAVGSDGKFVAGAGMFSGMNVTDETTNIEVLKELQSKAQIFSKESYTHTYPFCWRCKTRLIYYARDSWYVRMQDLRDTLLAENKKVHWEPAHIRDGRMGEWLANVKDWAISRERYWGTPLPVWEREDGKERMVIGSVSELKSHTKRSGNTYVVMRHGEAENNAKKIVSSEVDKNPLTAKGRQQVEEAVRTLTKPAYIYASPILRTKQTAEMVADALGFPKENIVFDDRLKEFSFGVYENKPLSEFLAYRETASFAARAPGGESYQDAKNRFGAFIYELEKKHQGETILIVTHGIGLESLTLVAEGLDAKASQEKILQCAFKNAEAVTLDFTPLPHNENYELDLHRPFIDTVILTKEGNEYRRVKEVMDVWFDSGAMPLAQDGYPASGKTPQYPADFISEAIDQTRGWFYTLLALGVLTGRGTPYKNVICLGHLLDAEGRKMSKSKGNVVDPWKEFDVHGVDTLRFWMYYVNQPGDSKNYDQKTVKEAARVISWLDNSTKFYELFKDGKEKGKEEIIDAWMKAHLEESTRTITKAMDQYEPYVATRELALLIENLSQWYVRRVRDRVRDGDAVAIATLRETLHTIARLIAPFSPFIAEEVYQAVKDKKDPDSVHLASWPSVPFRLMSKNKQLISEMELVRNTASYFLKLRQQKGIVVRQPLASLSTRASFSKASAALLAEEVNVKQVIQGASEEMLDTVLTPELIHEGDERALARAVAEARKSLGLSPKDKATVTRGSGPFSVELSTGTLAFSVSADEGTV